MKLEAVEVSKDFGSKRSPNRAVNNVSVEVESGGFVAIVGESGSGKSTLARLVLKLLPITEGKVLYNGKDMVNFSRAQMAEYRRNVQCILQDPSGSLNPRKSVKQAIEEVVRFHGITKTKREREELISETVEHVGLRPASMYLDRFPHELSGGQRQRVLIARAVILRPSFIIADEAVSALDVSVKASILNLMNKLRKEFNLGYLFITHDLPVVQKVATYVYVMRNGEVVEHGPTAQIFENPATDYVRELVASAPEPDPKAAAKWLEEITI